MLSVNEAPVAIIRLLANGLLTHPFLRDTPVRKVSCMKKSWRENLIFMNEKKNSIHENDISMYENDISMHEYDI